jgi:hypothetical protein
MAMALLCDWLDETFGTLRDQGFSQALKPQISSRGEAATKAT